MDLYLLAAFWIFITMLTTLVLLDCYLTLAMIGVSRSTLYLVCMVWIWADDTQDRDPVPNTLNHRTPITFLTLLCVSRSCWRPVLTWGWSPSLWSRPSATWSSSLNSANSNISGIVSILRFSLSLTDTSLSSHFTYPNNNINISFCVYLSLFNDLSLCLYVPPSFSVSLFFSFFTDTYKLSHNIYIYIYLYHYNIQRSPRDAWEYLSVSQRNLSSHQGLYFTGKICFCCLIPCCPMWYFNLPCSKEGLSSIDINLTNKKRHKWFLSWRIEENGIEKGMRYTSIHFNIQFFLV